MKTGRGSEVQAGRKPDQVFLQRGGTTDLVFERGPSISLAGKQIRAKL